MSDHIPFEIQSEIIKSLPAKSLIQFRSVSKQWKLFINNPEFIKNYHINHTNPQHHLLVRYKLDKVQTYISITDNDTFPQQKVPLTAPESLSLLSHPSILSSVDGLLCFYGQSMAVIWNPAIRKSVGIVIPLGKARDVVGFGVCPDTSDPKLVKISVFERPSRWEVMVFTLRTRVWKTVCIDRPFKSCHFSLDQIFVDGVIYFFAVSFDRGSWLYNVISFDMKSEKFGEVCLSERLLHASHLDLAKVNDSLGLLEYFYEGEMSVCGVWTRKDGANKNFTKIYTVRVEGKELYHRVLGFRNNGEVVIKLDDDCDESSIEVYDPVSTHINDVGINGKLHMLSVWSYMETLVLLNESDSIIR